MSTTVERIYTGPGKGGTVALPDRSVRFVAGEPVVFTDAEAALLEPADWSKPKAPKSDKSTTTATAGTKES